MLTHLILGEGEVGKAVGELLLETGQTGWVIGQRLELLFGDADAVVLGGIGPANLLHVCFPWDERFLSEVQRYTYRCGAPGCLILIHSTVPVGTTSQIENAVHCPVRGQHPKLALGMKSFVRYAGGPRAEEAKEVLLGMGCPEVVCVADSRVTEALKLWDTTYYAWNVVFEKAVHAYCEKHGLDFGTVYTHANTTYKSGYEILHRPGVARPILAHVPGPIGGHCLIPNCQLLDDDLARFILRFQDRLQQESSSSMSSNAVS